MGSLRHETTCDVERHECSSARTAPLRARRGAGGTPSRGVREKSFKNAKNRERSGLTRLGGGRSFALPRQGPRSRQRELADRFRPESRQRKRPKGRVQVWKGFGPERPPQSRKVERHPGEPRLRRDSVRWSAQRVVGKPATHWVDTGPPSAAEPKGKAGGDPESVLRHRRRSAAGLRLGHTDPADRP